MTTKETIMLSMATGKGNTKGATSSETNSSNNSSELKVTLRKVSGSGEMTATAGSSSSHYRFIPQLTEKQEEYEPEREHSGGEDEYTHHYHNKQHQKAENEEDNDDDHVTKLKNSKKKSTPTSSTTTTTTTTTTMSDTIVSGSLKKREKRSTKSKCSPGLRSGKWTPEEEAYTNMIIHYFKRGFSTLVSIKASEL
jgi:hypothetical protein